ncbi:MAG TPA: signal peptidase I [Candidatus Saccharimonadales bacterium]|nr:signal peptidase I [Candidatus Saccharimonadales bacterium]
MDPTPPQPPAQPDPEGIPAPTPVPATEPISPPATPPPAPAPDPPTPGPVAPPIPPQEPLIYPSPNQPEPTPEPTLTPEKSWLKTILLGVVNWLLIPLAIVLILHNFVFQAFHVIGSSMVPTLHDTDYLIVSKVGASQSALLRGFGRSQPYIPKRDQIIVFHYPQDPSLVFVKRVLGLPGERVVVHNGHVTIYNQAHPEGFDPDSGTNRADTATLGEIDEIVPGANVFVVGDNRTPNGSYDSREWGTLPYRYIIGEAVFRLLPIDQIKIL